MVTTLNNKEGSQGCPLFNFYLFIITIKILADVNIIIPCIASYRQPLEANKIRNDRNIKGTTI